MYFHSFQKDGRGRDLQDNRISSFPPTDNECRKESISEKNINQIPRGSSKRQW